MQAAIWRCPTKLIKNKFVKLIYIIEFLLHSFSYLCEIRGADLILYQLIAPINDIIFRFAVTYTDMDVIMDMDGLGLGNIGLSVITLNCFFFSELLYSIHL